ncbi:tail fiber protein [Mixta intestinalis]|uniref:Baseplate structural protein Gp10 C-terminal domain-containing protein n=1 Tax=Mixta intestinalis TaxID=1615494 RepID=A0A6P1Q0B3_9GAMM|nr:tail fiber protein [Mixta intestinalis]QHM71265.1 hypothetical protein C7M51_01551 [Mixta intestinalis]
MAKNEFLPFATADGANVLSGDEYQKLTARNNGFSAGVARSQELNTVWRQASVIAHVVAQFIANNSGQDIVDNGDSDSLLTYLEDALQGKINNTVPAASLTNAGIIRLSSATDSDDETMAATPKAVKAAYDMAKNVSIDGMYPVGIVLWFAQNKDPNKQFPGTTWKYIGESRTVRLASADGSDVMTTGGADSVTLTTANLPAHNHSFSGNTSSFDYGTKTTNNTGAHAHGGVLSRNNPYKIGGSNQSVINYSLLGNTDSAGAHAHTVGIGAHSHTVSGTTGNAGSGTAINITNAYVKLMGWWRTA